MKLTYKKLGPGKFDDNIDEWVYDQSMDGVDEEVGSVDEYGWYGLLILDPVTVTDEDSEWTFEAAIMHEDNESFIYVDYFDDEDKARTAWSKIEEEFAEWYDEDEDASPNPELDYDSEDAEIFLTPVDDGFSFVIEIGDKEKAEEIVNILDSHPLILNVFENRGEVDGTIATHDEDEARSILSSEDEDASPNPIGAQPGDTVRIIEGTDNSSGKTGKVVRIDDDPNLALALVVEIPGQYESVFATKWEVISKNPSEVMRRSKGALETKKLVDKHYPGVRRSRYTPNIEWNIYLDGVHVGSEIFGPSMTAKEVMKQLINEGFDPKITIKATSSTVEKSHEQKYDALNKKHHIKWDKKSPKLVGETLSSLRKKYKEDPNLNNVPLRRWDTIASAFLALNRRSGLSLAEAVCMQKHAAIDLIKRTEK